MENTIYIHELDKASKEDFGLDLNGQSYVDLGLPSGLLWATYNVGATEENLYGDLFAWGETEPKTDKAYWSNYKCCNGSYSSLKKYNVKSNYGTVDNKTTLELSDDAAHVNMGGDWRMPTKSECEELRENTVYSWGSRGGINGIILRSKNNGNSLFFPAAGRRNDGGLYSQGTLAFVWSSSVNENYLFGAWYLSGNQSSSVLGLYSDYRYYGRSVRGVIKK